MGWTAGFLLARCRVTVLAGAGEKSSGETTVFKVVRIELMDRAFQGGGDHPRLPGRKGSALGQVAVPGG